MSQLGLANFTWILDLALSMVGGKGICNPFRIRSQRERVRGQRERERLTDHSQVDMMASRYEPVSFGAGKSPGSPNLVRPSRLRARTAEVAQTSGVLRIDRFVPNTQNVNSRIAGHPEKGRTSLLAEASASHARLNGRPRYRCTPHRSLVNSFRTGVTHLQEDIPPGTLP